DRADDEGALAPRARARRVGGAGAAAALAGVRAGAPAAAAARVRADAGAAGVDAAAAGRGAAALGLRVHGGGAVRAGAARRAGGRAGAAVHGDRRQPAVRVVVVDAAVADGDDGPLEVGARRDEERPRARRVEVPAPGRVGSGAGAARGGRAGA